MEKIMKIIPTISVLCALFFLPIIVNAQECDMKLSLGHHHNDYQFPARSIVKNHHHYIISEKSIDSVLVIEDTLMVFLNKGDMTAIVKNNRVMGIEMTFCHPSRTIFLPLSKSLDIGEEHPFIIVYYGFYTYYFQRYRANRFQLLRCDVDMSLANIIAKNIPCRPPDRE